MRILKIFNNFFESLLNVTQAADELNPIDLDLHETWHTSSPNNQIRIFTNFFNCRKREIRLFYCNIIKFEGGIIFHSKDKCD